VTSFLDALPPNLAKLAKEARHLADAGNPDYPPAVLCQVGLPWRATEGRTFERTSGGVSLTVEADKAWNGMGWQQLPLPHGVRPRLALVHR
jgi:hypothetical protein